MLNFPHLAFSQSYWSYHGLLLYAHKPQPQALHRMKTDHEVAYRTVTGMKGLCSAWWGEVNCVASNTAAMGEVMDVDVNT